MAFVQNRDKKIIFLIITLTLVYAISFTFSDWALEQENADLTLLTYNRDIVAEDKNWNMTEQQATEFVGSETEDVTRLLLNLGGKLTFQQFLTLGFIGVGLTIFFNLFTTILWIIVILIMLSYIRNAIPFYSE